MEQQQQQLQQRTGVERRDDSVGAGFPIEELQLDLGTMRSIMEALNDPTLNSSMVINGNEFGAQRLINANGCRFKEIEVGYVCKKCHLAFRGDSTEDATIRRHQSQNGCCGILRVKRYLYACKLCDNNNYTFNAAIEMQQHLDSIHGGGGGGNRSSDVASPLTGEMEDVVNQITALAAATAKAASSTSCARNSPSASFHHSSSSTSENHHHHQQQHHLYHPNQNNSDANGNQFCQPTSQQQQQMIDNNTIARKSKLFIVPASNTVTASGNGQ